MALTPDSVPGPTAGDHSSVAGAANEFTFEFSNQGAQRLDIAELEAWPPRQGDRIGGTFPLWLDLRFAHETLLTENWRIEVFLSHSELLMTFVGCKPAPGTRLGDEQLAANQVLTQKTTSETELKGTVEGSAKGSASLVGGVAGSLSGSASGTAQSRKTTSQFKESEIVTRRVSARPNHTWEISEPEGQRLLGTYIGAPADEADAVPICRVVVDSAAFEITIRATTRPDDIDAKITPREGRPWLARKRTPKPTKTAIAKLLIQKACTERFSRDGDDRVTLACVALKGARS